jgi:hypothetical protein
MGQPMDQNIDPTEASSDASLVQFVTSLQETADLTSLTPPKTRYEKVSVILLAWKDTYNGRAFRTSEIKQIEALRRIFEDDYNFTAETYLMTWKNSTENVSEKLRSIEARHRVEGGLLIVYVNSLACVKDGCLILLAGDYGQ